MDEEEKTGEKVEEKPEEEKETAPTNEAEPKKTVETLDRADEIVERRNRVCEREEKILERKEALEARRLVGGETEAGQPTETKEQSAKDYATKVMENNA